MMIVTSYACVTYIAMFTSCWFWKLACSTWIIWRKQYIIVRKHIDMIEMVLRRNDARIGSWENVQRNIRCWNNEEDKPPKWSAKLGSFAPMYWRYSWAWDMLPCGYKEDVYPSSHQKEIYHLRLVCICFLITIIRGVFGEKMYRHNLPPLPRVKTRSTAFNTLGISWVRKRFATPIGVFLN